MSERAQRSVTSEADPTRGRRGDPCVLVIFGGTGDLTKRKLIPALYNLAREKLLPPQFAILGVSTSKLSDQDFRDRLTQDRTSFATGDIDPAVWNWLTERLHYLPGNVADDVLYDRIKGRLEEIRKEHGVPANYLYYLAVAPRFFAEIVRRLGASGLAREHEGWRRVIIEKPFGSDYDSARSLNAEIMQVLREPQIYRIDHYLGKETVQNIIVFRFGNGIFEPIWNRRYVDHVEITAAETLGVEQRGRYYDSAGALRDMVPNHMFQLLTLTAMEPPISFNAEAVHDEQAKILRAIQVLSPEAALRDAVRGQYGAGEVSGQRLPGYRQEESVGLESSTETFVAMRLMIDNWRWAGVPFYLRTGKRLSRTVTEIAIQFRRAPLILFRETPVEQLMTNRLVIHIQPDEGISLQFGAKIPGAFMKLGLVEMDFNYLETFGSTPNTGYERLIHDCMLGDATLFQRADMVEAAWSVIQPILDVWRAVPPRSFPNYAAGSWGPPEADELIKFQARHWRKIE